MRKNCVYYIIQLYFHFPSILHENKMILIFNVFVYVLILGSNNHLIDCLIPVKFWLSVLEIFFCFWYCKFHFLTICYWKQLHWRIHQYLKRHLFLDNAWKTQHGFKCYLFSDICRHSWRPPGPSLGRAP